MAEDRLSTGITGLDELLGGGVYPGVNLLVTGGAGTGKTTFSLQFLVEGARLGERGMYLTFEESSRQIIRYGSKFFPDLKSLMDNGLIQIIDFSPHTIAKDKFRLIDGQKVVIPPKEQVDSVGYIENKILDIRGQSIRRVVLDGIQTFATTFYDLSGKQDEDELRRTLSRIMIMLKEENVTTYTVSELREEEENKYDFINFTADGVFVLKTNEALDMRVIRIMKMRGIRHTLKPMSIEFIEGQGVVITGKR